MIKLQGVDRSADLALGGNESLLLNVFRKIAI